MKKKYRNEWKYLCSFSQLKQIEQKIMAVLEKDPHMTEDCYHVHSLYFDDLNNACAFDTDAGSSSRFKYRIRYYDRNVHYVRLERKEKLNGRCFKAVCPLKPEEYSLLFSGDVCTLASQAESPVLRRFCADILTRGFTPRLIIDCERTAYIEPIANVRVTLDMNISASGECGRFLEGDYLRTPLLSANRHVLEVKFDEILPGYVSRIFHDCGLQQTSFSKYNQGIQKLRRL